jgi:3alpha(or 20beta)-hydroxysteroid dehydrogenase
MPGRHTAETSTATTPAFDGKVVIITGAARGQGAREAELFAAAGARVVATDVRDDLGRELAARLGERGAYLHHDVTRLEDWRRVVSSPWTRSAGSTSWSTMPASTPRPRSRRPRSTP